MFKKIRNIIYIIGATLLLSLFFLVILFFRNSSYRSQLPAYPDFRSIPEPVKEQIIASGRKAYLNPSDNNLGMLGMVYYSSANYDKANQCFELAAEKNEKNWIWNYFLGYLNLEMGESKTSLENFKNVLENDSNNYFALFHTAEAYQNLGLFVNAENIFKKIAGLDDRYLTKNNSVRNNEFSLQIYASFRLARIYIGMNYLDSAEFTLKELISEQMTFGPAYRLLGDVYKRQGDSGLASKYTICANDLADYTPPSDMLIDKIALISRSDTYLLKQIDDAIQSENYQWALKLSIHAIKYFPENKYLISKTLFGFFVLGFDKEALPYLDQHMNLFSDDFNELMHLADLLYSRGFDLYAMKYFNQAKKLKPGNSRLAIWLMERGMENDAVNLINDQLKKDPENVKILVDAANMMLHMGQMEKAVEYLELLKKLSPANPEALKASGMLEEKKGNLRKAIIIYEDALKSNQKDLNLIKYLSAIYIREKMWNKAVTHFESALLNYPNEPILLNGLGRLLISCPDTNLRNVDAAREYFKRTFVNYRSTYSTKVSAGRDLATAFAILGDKQNSSKYINLTVDLAREKNISFDFTYFDTLKKQYKISE